MAADDLEPRGHPLLARALDGAVDASPKRIGRLRMRPSCEMPFATRFAVAQAIYTLIESGQAGDQTLDALETRLSGPIYG